MLCVVSDLSGQACVRVCGRAAREGGRTVGGRMLRRTDDDLFVGIVRAIARERVCLGREGLEGSLLLILFKEYKGNTR